MDSRDQRFAQRLSAASVQSALEDALLYLVQHLREVCSSENLCYAGGVALNSVANKRMIRESGFKNVYIMPAAEDGGRTYTAGRREVHRINELKVVA